MVCIHQTQTGSIWSCFRIWFVSLQVVAAEFPGDVRLRVTEELDTHPPDEMEPYPVFRMINEDGSLRGNVDASSLDKDELMKMYTYMIRVQALDTVFYDAQRQGRISFYMQVCKQDFDVAFSLID